jgi:hypothetical protein
MSIVTAKPAKDAKKIFFLRDLGDLRGEFFDFFDLGVYEHLVYRRTSPLLS